MFKRFTDAVSSYVGSPYALIAAILTITIWAFSGFAIGFTDTWQLIINTSTTIITFLMTFIIQATQNRDNKAIHAKLDELLHVTKEAKNEFINIESLDDKEIERLKSGINNDSTD